LLAVNLKLSLVDTKQADRSSLFTSEQQGMRRSLFPIPYSPHPQSDSHHDRWDKDSNKDDRVVWFEREIGAKVVNRDRDGDRW
jgi:hypothetical protein